MGAAARAGLCATAIVAHVLARLGHWIGGSDLRCQNAYTRLLLGKRWSLLHGYFA